MTTRSGWYVTFFVAGVIFGATVINRGDRELQVD
jgi:hypothetical protein